MIKTQLILVRHGQSLWNLENRFTGWVDVELSEAGVTEARRAGGLLTNYRFNAAFTSALIRAQHTLQLILEVCGQPDIPVFEDKALNERMYGDLQGLDKLETKNKYGEEQFNRWRRSYLVAPPGGESLQQTQQRVMIYFNSTILPQLLLGETLLVVAHGNSLRALMMELEGLSPEQIEQTDIATAVPRVYTYQLKAGRLILESVRNL